MTNQSRNKKQISINTPSKENSTTMNKLTQVNPVSIPQLSEENSNIMHEHSQVNSSAISDTSIKNPPTKIFSFKMRPARKLKLAIESLSDSDFNPKGLGRIDVDQKGFEITVCSTESGARGILLLKASGLMDFKCNKPIEGKMVQLAKISENLVAADDEDTITIYLLEGSSDLFFMFGGGPSKGFSVELRETKFQFNKFPEILFFCEAVVPSENFRLLLSLLSQEEKPQIVLVDMMRQVTLISVLDKTDMWTCPYDEKHGGTRGMEAGERHLGCFNWPHSESLKKASLLDTGLLVCFVADPQHNIMFRFNLRELGDLVYINNALIIPNMVNPLEPIPGIDIGSYYTEESEAFKDMVFLSHEKLQRLRSMVDQIVFYH